MKKTYIASCYFKHNYGSMLQAYATQEFLDENKIKNYTFDVSYLEDFKQGKLKYYKTQIFSYSFYKAKLGMIKLKIKRKLNRKLNKNLKKRDQMFQQFQDEYFHLTDAFKSYDEMNKFCSDNAANVIVGSDQLWLPVNVIAKYYTLDFVPDNVNKVSYSTSFGISSISKKYEKNYKNFLQRINKISVREETGRKIVNGLVGVQCSVVCDPTMLLNTSQWEKIIDKEPIYKEKYILCYFLGKEKKHRLFAEKLKKITGFKIVSINHCDEFVKYSDHMADFVPYDIGPKEWLNLIKNAEYICTDSFHGSLFSILFNKRFFTFRRYPNKSKFSTNSRLDTLLNIAGYGNSIFDGQESILDIKKAINKIFDYNEINKKIDEYRIKSREFLLNSLTDSEKISYAKHIEIVDKNKCSGCYACYSSCPTNAIEMIKDKEGFDYPKVIENKCIGCSKCKDVCRIINPISEVKSSPQYAYIVQNKNKSILSESTSGGAFTPIAEYIIGTGGIVFGAALVDGIVRHIAVDNIKDLSLFRGSKYVQSKIGNCFIDVKKLLIDGKNVLFSGTSCQIEGLKSFLGKEFDNLFTVDVVCRAVPSPLVYEKYYFLKQKQYKLKESSIRFRDKRLYGYNYSNLTLSDKNNKIVYHGGINKDSYLKIFFTGLCNRPSCSSCKFKKVYRQSDITIWDCFDISSYDKNLDNNLGATKVLIHSSKGKVLFDGLLSDFNYKECEPNEIIFNANELKHPTPNSPKRSVFVRDLNELDDKVLFKKYTKIKIKDRVVHIIKVILIRSKLYSRFKAKKMNS